MNLPYKTLISFERNNKQIVLFLKEGEQIFLDNIEDVFIYPIEKEEENEDKKE